MAMSVIWTGLVALSLLFSFINGSGAQLSDSALEGASAGISLSLSMAGAICLWSGLCKVMSEAGISALISKALSPLLSRLYPVSSRHREIAEAISSNVSANLLGLGNAATPLGVKATTLMSKLSGRDSASDEMCTFIVMNTASIQLIPSTAAAVRAACGCASPFDILPAVWLASACSVTAGLAAASILKRLWPKT